MRQMAQGTTPANMMQFRSTQGMAQFVRETPQKIIIMATEVGNIHPLSKAAPGKTVIPASPEAICAYMKQNTFRKLHLSLRDNVHEIKVDPVLAARARLPIPGTRGCDFAPLPARRVTAPPAPTRCDTPAADQPQSFLQGTVSLPRWTC